MLASIFHSFSYLFIFLVIFDFYMFKLVFLLCKTGDSKIKIMNQSNSEKSSLYLSLLPILSLP